MTKIVEELTILVLELGSLYYTEKELDDMPCSSLSDYITLMKTL
jgi:hypothetical protein